MCKKTRVIYGCVKGAGNESQRHPCNVTEDRREWVLKMVHKWNLVFKRSQFKQLLSL